MTIIASADGSALGNPGPAGWAWYIDPTSWQAGGWAHGTNNQGELTAVLNLLEETRHRREEPLRVLCDSQYVINSVTKWMPGWKKKGWKKRDGKPVLNVDIMKALDRELSGRSVTFEWVKGHAGHELNEAADVRARAMATAYQARTSPEDMPVGPGFRDEDATPASRHASGAEPSATDATAPASGAAAPVHAADAAAPASSAATAPPSAEGGTSRPAATGHAAAGGGAPAGPPSAAPGDGMVSQPDLFSELEAASPPSGTQESAGVRADGWSEQFVVDAVQRERAAVCTPPGAAHETAGASPRAAASPHAAEHATTLLHPDLQCIDAGGAVVPVAQFPSRAVAEGTPGEVRVTALGADAYHVSYRLEEPSHVTRRSSVWVREDQHNDMGPWLLRFHQVTAED